MESKRRIPEALVCVVILFGRHFVVDVCRDRRELGSKTFERVVEKAGMTLSAWGSHPRCMLEPPFPTCRKHGQRKARVEPRQLEQQGPPERPRLATRSSGARCRRGAACHARA